MSKVSGCLNADFEPFVPELDQIMKKIMPGIDLKSLMRNSNSSYQIGTVGIVNSLVKYADLNNKDIKYIDYKSRRNVVCEVKGFEMNLPVDNRELGIKVSFSYYIKKSGLMHGFPQAVIISQYSKDKSKVHSLEIDYMYAFDDDESENESLNFVKRTSVFNLPLFYGCSQHLVNAKSYINHIGHSKDAQMSLVFSTNEGAVTVAVDSETGLVRRKHGSKTVIWDTKRQLAYATIHEIASSTIKYSKFDGNFSNKNQEVFPSIQKCSILEPSDDHNSIPPYYYPYSRNSNRNSIDLKPISLLVGSDDEGMKGGIAYMGVGYVRDLPCHIYEAVLNSPPKIFALSGVEMSLAGEKLQTVNDEDNDDDGNQNPGQNKRKYIVSYFMFEDFSNESSLTDSNNGSWWPAQIVVHELIIDTGEIFFLKSVDVYEFSWTLLGLDENPVSLFDVSECFIGSAHQRRIVELLLQFEDTSTTESGSINFLTQNKFISEFEICKKVASKLGISQLDLINYELVFRGNNQAIVRFKVVNRDVEQKLVWHGLIKRPEKVLGKQVIIGDNMDEGSCVLQASLIEKINLAMFCSDNMKNHQTANIGACVALYDSIIPEISSTDLDDNTACSMFTFSPDEDDVSSGDIDSEFTPVHRVMKRRYSLLNEFIEFSVLSNTQNSNSETAKRVTVRAKIVDFEINAPLILNHIDHSTFALTTNIEGRQYNNFADVMLVPMHVQLAADCNNLCSLDPSCKSYSFCPKQNQFECMLSTVDIQKDYTVEDIIDFSASDKLGTNSTGTVSKVLVTNNSRYKLLQVDSCSINQQNYLNSYQHTNELVKLSKNVVDSFIPKSADGQLLEFDCARQGALIERSDATKRISMFAVCMRSGACILDDRILEPNLLLDGGNENFNQSNSELCLLYRKKYHTFFHLSSRVAKTVNDLQQQISISLTSIEECAKICWIEMGKECASFDYCSKEKAACTINKFVIDEIDNPDNDKLILKDDCHHYERDIEFDKIRHNFDIGRHVIFDQIHNDDNGIIDEASNRNIILWCTTLALIGLISGFVLGGFTLQARVNTSSWYRNLSSNNLNAASTELNNAVADRTSSFQTSFSNPATAARDSVQMKTLSRNDSIKQNLLDEKNEEADYEL